ncbi:MAG TPA: hypothetical protein DDY78_28190 [Planctomycetales bacterium]|jgi:hypothetical protein|nr:hypothetical protein [Planctomycetales bacterium]
MSTTDDTEIFPTDERGDTPAPNGRAPRGALTASALPRERGCTAAGTPAGLPPRILTALLYALSVWST